MSAGQVEKLQVMLARIQANRTEAPPAVRLVASARLDDAILDDVGDASADDATADDATADDATADDARAEHVSAEHVSAEHVSAEHVSTVAEVASVDPSEALLLDEDDDDDDPEITVGELSETEIYIDEDGEEVLLDDEYAVFEEESPPRPVEAALDPAGEPAAEPPTGLHDAVTAVPAPEAPVVESTRALPLRSPPSGRVAAVTAPSAGVPTPTFGELLGRSLSLRVPNGH